MTSTAPGIDYLDTLARFVAATRFDAIPATVIARTKVIIADTLPVIAAGMQSPELTTLVSKQLAELGREGGAASIIGTGRRTNRLDAGMLNGIAGAWHDFDEGNFAANGHPGIQVIPAALATAQARGATGAELLAAIALGYEVVARIGAATKMKLIVNPHGTYGVVGAALAVARLSGLAPERFRELASLAASSCMATNRHTMLNGATVRNWYAGHSATMGQMAVRLIESGFTGPADGVNTTFSLVLGDGFTPAIAIDRLGEYWHLTEGYIKLYPTARYAHSGIDAFFDAIAKAPGVTPDAIERVDMRAYRLAAFLKNQHPTNWFGTRFSIPFACATLLVGGRAGLAAFDDQAVADPAVQALAARIHVTEDESLNADYPARQRVFATVRLRDGSTLEGRCEVTSGEPDNPHPVGAIERKFFDLASPIWGRERAGALNAAVMRLESCRNVAQLVEFEL
jgi:2-methylcitrate dehydratase PrpD